MKTALNFKIKKTTRIFKNMNFYKKKTLKLKFIKKNKKKIRKNATQ